MNELDPKILEDINAFCDGELSASEQAEVERLLESSEAYRKALELTQSVKARLKETATPPEMPASLRAQVNMALDQEIEQNQPMFNFKNWLHWAPVQGLALVTVVVLLFLVMQNQTLDTPIRSGAGGKGPIQVSYDFTDLTHRAAQRHYSNQTFPHPPSSPEYKAQFASTGLGDVQMPSLESENFQSEGCCFGMKEGNRIAHFIYSGEEGQDLCLLMWKRLSEKDVITGEKEQFEGLDYFVTVKDGVNLVLWKDGDVYCSMFGKKQESKQLLRLASMIRQKA